MPRQKWKNPSGTREYFSWRSMRQRCVNPNHKSWKNYGGRGIDVCSLWLKSYDAFFEDMGPCPEGYTLERIDNEKGYHLENCKWASMADQSNNRRNLVRITLNGETRTLTQWASFLGLNVDTLHKRLQRMSAEKALTGENLIQKNRKPLIHGTLNGYRGYRCRCSKCISANTEYHRKRRHERKYPCT